MNKIKKLAILNITLIIAIVGVSLDWTSSTNQPLEKDAMVVNDLRAVNKIQIDDHLIIRQDDGRWVIDQAYDVAPEKLGALFRVLNQWEVKRNIQLEEDLTAMQKLLQDSGKHIVIYAHDIPVKDFTLKGISNTETVVMNEERQLMYVQVPGFFTNMDQIFASSADTWRDKTLFRTSWKTMKNFSVLYHVNPENSFEITFDSTFYQVSHVTALDSANVYQYITDLPRIKALAYTERTSLMQDTIAQFNPFCTIEMHDLNEYYDIILDIYPTPNVVYGHNQVTNEVAEIEPRVIQNILVNSQAFQARRRSSK